MIRIDDSIWDLKLVIEKADRLQRRQFTKYLRDGGNIGFCGKQQDNGFVVTYEGPDEEAIDAFLFTFRFFVQNNEPTSFANIEKLFSSLPLEPERIDAVVRSRKVVNDYLDQESHIVISGKLTRRHIFEVFLWGGLAHANRQKKETFDKWSSLGALPFLQVEFVTTLVYLLNGILWFRQASSEALNILETQASEQNAGAP